MTSFAGPARLAAGLIAAFVTLSPAIAADAPEGDPWTPAQRVRIEAVDAWRLKVLPASLRLRVLLTQPDREEPTGAFRMPGPDRSLPQLVDLARGSTDPLVLMVLGQRCGIPVDASPCDAGALARRWVEAETQNQAAWIRLAMTQGLVEERPEALETFRRAAQASTWNDHLRDVSRTLLSALPPDTPLELRVDALEFAQAPMAGSSPIELLQGVSRGCKVPSLRDACLRILDTMARDTDNLVTQGILVMLSRRAGVPDAGIEDRQRRLDLALAGVALLPGSMTGPLETRTPEDMRQEADRIEDMFRNGDLVALAHVRERSGIPEATLLADARARRIAREREIGTPLKAVP